MFIIYIPKGKARICSALPEQTSINSPNQGLWKVSPESWLATVILRKMFQVKEVETQ